MAKETIFVSIIEGTTELTFKDSAGKSGKEITTVCKCGDQVRWLASSKGLDITGIPMKDGTPSIWAEGKRPSKAKQGWVGTICETAAGKTAAYSVQYTINEGRILEQDPQIQVDDENQGGN